MGLDPKQPQENPQYDWDWLNRHLKLHLATPGSRVGIFPDYFQMSRSEILEELIKNGYTVDTSNDNNWQIS